MGLFGKRNDNNVYKMAEKGDVSGLLKALESEDSETRQSAADMLMTMGVNTPELNKVLAERGR